MPDRRKTMKPSTTEGRRVPGAFEGETVTRRRFMTGGASTFGALAAAAFALPALGFAVGPVFERNRARWEDVGPVGDLPSDVYVPRVITTVGGVGEAGKTTVYVRRHNPALDGPMDAGTLKATAGIVAISTRCNHLGCPVRYTPAAQRFICPCHGGVYDFQGKVTGGPPVRPLDRFYTRVVAGRVQIGPRYSVNSELRRFAPRDPGEALDGIGQYAYPSRFSTAKP